MAKLSEARSQPGVATVGTRVLFAGGSRGGYDRTRRDHLDVVDIYDAATGAWSVGALSLARERPQVVAVGGQVPFIGGVLGYNGCMTDFLNPIVDIYDSATGP